MNEKKPCEYADRCNCWCMGWMLASNSTHHWVEISGGETRILLHSNVRKPLHNPDCVCCYCGVNSHMHRIEVDSLVAERDELKRRLDTARKDREYYRKERDRWNGEWVQGAKDRGALKTSHGRILEALKEYQDWIAPRGVHDRALEAIDKAVKS